MRTPQIQAPQLLAPAGGRAQFLAALHAGADAVYLGLKAFSARASAENFSIDDLRELIPLAHRYGMKVLVAFNTLVAPGEVDAAIRFIVDIAALEADGLIVQDFGVASLVRRHFPSLPLHASTQMAVHGLGGVRWMQSQGFRRVVLARELSIAEIAAVRAAFAPDEMELEVFCHGSLCHSYSGICLFGGIADGRSGNRGECPYPCRRSFRSPCGEGFLFSMRDLDSRPLLPALVTAGVDVLKIEGRKKDAQYVAATLKAYRKALNAIFGRDTLRAEAPSLAREFLAAQGADELAYSFRREPTTLFLEGGRARALPPTTSPRATSHSGILAGNVDRQVGSRISFVTRVPLERFDGLEVRLGNGDEGGFSLRDLFVRGRRMAAAPAGERVDVELPSPMAAEGREVFKVRSAALRSTVENLTTPKDRLKALWPIDLSLRFERRGEVLGLHVEARKFGEPFATLETSCALVPGRRASPEEVASLFSLLGDAGFAADRVEVAGLPAEGSPRQGDLKAARRELGQHLVHELASFLEARRARIASEAVSTQHVGPVPPGFVWGAGDASTLLLAQEHADELLLRCFSPTQCTAALPLLSDVVAKLRMALPPVVRDDEVAAWQRLLDAAIERGVSRFEISNVGSFELLKKHVGKVSLSGGPWLYARNRFAARAWREAGLESLLLSPEATVEEWLALVSECKTGFMAPVVHAFPVMISESCARRGLSRCAGDHCAGWTLRDEAGRSWSMETHGCRSFLMPGSPIVRIHDAAPLRRSGVNAFLVDVTGVRTPEPLLGEALRALSREARGALEAAHGPRSG